MIFLCKLNIFFIFNSLLLVFTADLSTNEENGKKSSDEMIILKFEDAIKEISRLDFEKEYFICINDDVFKAKHTNFDCSNISSSVLENYKKLGEIYLSNDNSKEYNMEETMNMFKDIIFSNFLSFLRTFGEKSFIHNKKWYLTYVQYFFKKILLEFKDERGYTNRETSDLHQKEINFYTSLILNQNFEEISAFIYISIHLKKEIILKFKDIKCYIKKIGRYGWHGWNLRKAYNYEIHISKIKNDQFSNGRHNHNYLELLTLLQGFVEYLKFDHENFEFSFNIILNYKKDDYAEVAEYGSEFISGVKKIVNENNKNENPDATQFLYCSQQIEKGDKIESKALQFELKESEVEGEPSTKFLVSFEDVISLSDSI